MTLAAHGISLRYGPREIITDTSLTIPAGKVTVIVGANGSGKSTLLKSLARQLKPSTGTVTLNGTDVWAQSPKQVARVVGFLPQAPLAPDGLTVAQLVANGRMPHQGLFARMSSTDGEVIEAALTATNTRDLAKVLVTNLSGGQRQRVWIAMVMAQQPEILLLDEPTTWLDVTHQLDVLDLLVGMNRTQGTTIAMVLHDLNLAARYADHLIAVAGGTIHAQGNPDEVLTRESLQTVFGLDAQIHPDPITGTPLVVPLDRQAA